MKTKKFVTYAKKNLVLIKMIKIIREAAHSICNVKYKTSKEIPIIFCNGSTYDYHFIIK